MREPHEIAEDRLTVNVKRAERDAAAQLMLVTLKALPSWDDAICAAIDRAEAAGIKVPE